MQVSCLPGSDVVSICKRSSSPMFRMVEVRSSSVQAVLDWVTSQSPESPATQDSYVAQLHEAKDLWKLIVVQVLQ